MNGHTKCRIPQIIDYYLHIKGNEVLKPATRMNLENITLREGSQSQKATYSMIPLI